MQDTTLMQETEKHDCVDRNRGPSQRSCMRLAAARTNRQQPPGLEADSTMSCRSTIVPRTIQNTTNVGKYSSRHTMAARRSIPRRQ